MQIILLLFQLLFSSCLGSYSVKKVSPRALCQNSTCFSASQCIYLINGSCSHYDQNSTQGSLGCLLGKKKVAYAAPSQCHTPLSFTLDTNHKGILVWTQKKRESLVLKTYLLNFKLYPEKYQYTSSKRQLLTSDNIPVAEESSTLIIKKLIDPLQLYEEELFSLLLLANQYFTSRQNQTIYLTLGSVLSDAPLPAWLNIQQVNIAAIQLIGIPPAGAADESYILALGAFDSLNNRIVQAFEFRVGKKKEVIVSKNSDTIVSDFVLGLTMFVTAFGLTKLLVEHYFPFLEEEP